MFTIKNVMTNPVLTVDSGKSLMHVADIMKKHLVGGLPVVEGGNLLGIITSRDVRVNHPNRIVADAMTSPVICCAPLDNILDAAELMQKHSIERLPVQEDGVVGIVTKGQIMKNIGHLYDPLTEIYNSSYIYLIAKRLFSEENEISVILFDIDNFGEFNKKWGHVNGDKCLKGISGIIRESAENEYSYICRYGGDEFVIITLNKTNQAEGLANYVIDRIAAETSQKGQPVTVSAGICGGHRRFIRHTDDLQKAVENLINKASLASTKAKILNQKYIVE